eukprot:1657605-Pleurochrysis_carterae.AAC.1
MQHHIEVLEMGVKQFAGARGSSRKGRLFRIEGIRRAARLRLQSRLSQPRWRAADFLESTRKARHFSRETSWGKWSRYCGLQRAGRFALLSRVARSLLSLSLSARQLGCRQHRSLLFNRLASFSQRRVAI